MHRNDRGGNMNKGVLKSRKWLSERLNYPEAGGLTKTASCAPARKQHTRAQWQPRWRLIVSPVQLTNSFAIRVMDRCHGEDDDATGCPQKRRCSCPRGICSV